MAEPCSRAIWVGFRSHYCPHPAKFAITSKATGKTFYRCGKHVKRYDDPKYYDIQPVSAAAESPK